MKTLLTTLLLIGVMSFTPATTDFCTGWKHGYVQGFCYDVNYGCVAPPVPVCPVPRVGQDAYKDGYNRGFLQGKWDKENGR